MNVDRTIYERMLMYESLVDISLELVGCAERIVAAGSNTRKVRQEELRCSSAERCLQKVERMAREVIVQLGDDSPDGIAVKERIERAKLAVDAVDSIADCQMDWRRGLACFLKHSPELRWGEAEALGAGKVYLEGDEESGYGKDSQEELGLEDYVAVEH